MEKVNTCSICGEVLTKYLETKDYFNTQEAFDLLLCSECQLLHTSPIPDEHELDRYYDSDNYLSHHSDNTDFVSILYKNIRKITLRNKLALISEYATDKTILDYGCGTGEFLQTCKLNQWAISGLEPNIEARQFATELTGTDIQTSRDQLRGQYSIITLWHVLEHLKDPVIVINSLKKHLKKQGHIILALPNYKSPDADYYKSYWAGYDVPRHLFHFSKSAIKRITEKTGMKIVTIEPMKFDSFYVSLLSEKYIRPGKIPYLRATRQGMASNRKASKNNQYSSLIYVITEDT